MMNWIKARLSEPSTYGGIAGLLLIGCFVTFTFWPHWRLLGYAAGVLFVAQSLLAEKK